MAVFTFSYAFICIDFAEGAFTEMCFQSKANNVAIFTFTKKTVSSIFYYIILFKYINP